MEHKSFANFSNLNVSKSNKKKRKSEAVGLCVGLVAITLAKKAVSKSQRHQNLINFVFCLEKQR